MFLVKHSYVDGWHLPGGGVENGETFVEALRRELVEEGRIELSGEPALHGLFFNSHVSRRDHVAVYVVREFSQDRLPEPNREIIACGFFDACGAAGGDHQGNAAADIGSAAGQSQDRDLDVSGSHLVPASKTRKIVFDRPVEPRATGGK